MDKQVIEDILNEMHLLHPEELTPKARKLFNAIMEIADERDKYKALYQNEKSHSDTLEKIINKIIESKENLHIYHEVTKDNHGLTPPYKVTCSCNQEDHNE